MIVRDDIVISDRVPPPIVFRLDVHTVTEGNAKEHWRTKHKRARLQRGTAAMVTYGEIVTARWMVVRDNKKPSRWGHRRLDDNEKIVVTMTRIAPRALDDDNLASSQKHVRDGIADALDIDDRDARVNWKYKQRRGRPKEYAVEVSIEVAS